MLTDAGVEYAAVATNDEAFAIRHAGFEGRLMRVRSATVSEALAAQPCGIEELAASADFAAAIADVHHPAVVHLPLNCMGMGRDGLELTSQAGREAVRRILSTPGLSIAGIATHFPSSSHEDLEAGRDRFLQEVEWVIAEGRLDRDAIIVHAASSLGLLADAGIEFDMVRCGACLFGIVGPRPEFDDVVTLKSRVTSINALPAGATLGYDRTWRLTRDSRIANVSIGYANGIRREMSGRASVLVREHLAPIVGRISMNALTVDVTDIIEATAGDEVVLFGAQGESRITRRSVESASGTIMADLYCDWGRSNPRQYLRCNDAGSARVA